MFKVNNRKNRTRCEICSKLIMNTPERRPQNGQTHSNNSSTTADELFECV